MKTAYFTLLISVLAVSVLAGSYQVVYQEQIAGAELFTYIDPVIDTSTLPQGFIFADPSVRQFVYRLISAESTIVFSTSNKPVMTLNVRAADSLLIFALSRTRIGPGEFLGRPELRRICLTGGIISDSSAVMTYPGWWGNVVSIWYERIAFDSPPPNASGVILEQCVYWDNYETTQGWEYKAISGARLFGFDLRPGSTMMPVTSARPANLTDDPGKEFAWYNKYYYSYDFRDSADDPNFGPWDQLYSGVSLNSGDTLISCWSNHGGYLRIFAEDLIPGNALDEVLFYGYAVDMTGQHGAANHAACYSFASGAPEEIWYTPLSGITLDYVYKPQHFIAGMRGANKVIALNYWTGLLCDSINLDRNLTATTFFETGSDPSSLNLVGRNYDTVFVYQFRTPTDVRVEPALGLPSTFALAQNYPNPFNNETIISFTNPAHQNLALLIYNVLGQRVRSLRDGETPPGEYSLQWDGRDDDKQPLASGVYFARLISPTDSRLIKLVLLK